MTKTLVIEDSRYRPAFAEPRQRGALIAALLLLHAALIGWLVGQTVGPARPHAAEGHGGRGHLVAFDLRASTAEAASARPGGGESGTSLSSARPDRAAPADRAGQGDPPRPGGVSLGAELAAVLAVDPLAGGGLSDYEHALRLHIARHSAGMRDRLLRTGTVMLRFRVARDGSVIDAKVLGAPPARLAELALAALWRAVPLPPVPDHLSVPLEVDLPLDIRGQG